MDSNTAKLILNSIGLENVLKSMGFRYKDTGDYFTVSSPFREDKNPSMVVYKNSGHCRDFGGSFSGSIFKLFKSVTGQSISQFFEVSRTFLLDEAFKTKVEAKARRSFLEVKGRNIEVEGTLYPIETSSVAMKYCRKRKLNKEFRNFFNIKWSLDATFNGVPFNNRIVIPIIENGSPVNYEGRSVVFPHGDSKKVLYVKGGSAGSLFNLDNLDREEPLIVVEGIMDLPQIWTHISKNVTTTYGIQLTYKQTEMLRGFKHIILFPDGDEGGKRFIDNLDAVYDHEFFIAMHESLDPGDMSLDEIKTCLDNKVSAVKYFMKESELFEEPE